MLVFEHWRYCLSAIEANQTKIGKWIAQLSSELSVLLKQNIVCQSHLHILRDVIYLAAVLRRDSSLKYGFMVCHQDVNDPAPKL